MTQTEMMEIVRVLRDVRERVRKGDSRDVVYDLERVLADLDPAWRCSSPTYRA